MTSSSSPPISVGTLFLGGGNAAGYFAAEFDKIVSSEPSLKDSAFAGSLAIVSGEDKISYERPALSKAYLAPKTPARLPGFHSCVGGGGERHDAAWYEAKGIRYLLGSEATSVDASTQTVTLADGPVLKYQKLVIATGARPVDLAKEFKMPGAVEGGGGASGNVFYLWDVAGADRLYSALEKAAAASASDSSGARPLVIGGGYIGENREREREREREIRVRGKKKKNEREMGFLFPSHALEGKKNLRKKTLQASSSQPAS